MPSTTEPDLFAFEFADADSTRQFGAFADLFADEFGVELIHEPSPTSSVGTAGEKGSTEIVMCMLSMPMALHATILRYKEMVLERRLGRIIQFVKEHELKVRVKRRGGGSIDLHKSSPTEMREFLEGPAPAPAPKQPPKHPK